MKNTLKMMAGVAAVLVGFSTSMQAVPINGDITFSGGVQMNGTANTATMVTSWVAPITVTSVDGNFTPDVSLGDLVTLTAPWSFNSGALAALWSVDGFTFDLIQSAIVTQGGGNVYVTGTGTISGNGFDASVGSWSFDTSNPSAGSPPVFSFRAGTTVPDGGATVGLLGLALGACSLIARRIKRA